MGVVRPRIEDKHKRHRPRPGALRLSQFWIVEPEEGAVHLHDRPPSVESCDLGVSIFHVAAEDVHDLSLDDTLRDTFGRERKPYQQPEICHIDRGDMEIAWLEQRYVTEQCRRGARFRGALARGRVLCLISMNYGSNRAAGPECVWDEVLRTLVTGVHIADPTAGRVVQ